MKKIILLICFCCITFNIQAQTNPFEESYQVLVEMLETPEKYSFKKAVFSVENAYYDGGLNIEKIEKQIKGLTEFSNKLLKQRTLDYQEKDKGKINKFATVFSILTDTIPIHFKDKKAIYVPYAYDFNDPFGHRNWSNMFVSKLLETKRGNCHSLPYLYKILVEELGETAHLALAPNHIYIKQRSKRDGWYNTELTSGIFPIDAWLMASGYIHLDAIKNGVYMKALNNNESIALCLLDLAQVYNKKIPYNDGKFVLKCCLTALQYFSNNVNAMLIASEAKRKQIESYLEKMQGKFPDDIFKHEKSTTLFKQMEQLVARVHELGYRKMPEQMYLDWLVSLNAEKQKYSNQKINTFKISK